MANSSICNLKITSHVINLDENGRPDGAPEKDEISLVGSITEERGETIISYKEVREGSSVSCEVTLKKGSVTVRRRGDVSCDMLFSPGKPYKTLYTVPPFSFDMEINTLRIENSFDNGFGTLSLFYDMTVGGAKKRCRMKIIAKN